MKAILRLMIFMAALPFFGHYALAAPWVYMTLTYDYSNHTYSAEAVYIRINGNLLENLSMPPVIMNGYTLVPARETLEAAGAVVDWKKETEEIFVAYNETIAILKIGDTAVNVNGDIITLPCAPKIINNKAMLPIRFLSDGLGLSVDWNNSTRTVSINIIAERLDQLNSVPQYWSTPPKNENSSGTVDESGSIIRQFDNDFYYDTVTRQILIANNGVIIPNNALGIDMKLLTFSEDYYEKNYSIGFKAGISCIAKSGKYMVNSGDLNYISLKTAADGYAEITINSDRTLAYDITQENDYIYITPKEPKERYGKIVVVDAGHGGSDAGSDANGIIEKELNLDITLRLIKLLEADESIKVYATRRDDSYYSRPERASVGNELGDLFVSVHNNYFTSDVPNGTEVLYYPHENDAALGFSSERFAQILQSSLVSQLGSKSRDIRQEPMDVLTMTKIPAVLCEVGFITNSAEAEKLKNDSYKQAAANAIYKGIVEAFNEYTPQR